MIDKEALIKLLRKMDHETDYRSQRGDAELVWFYWRDDVENVLGLERGALSWPYDDGNNDDPIHNIKWPEDEEI